MGAAPYLYEGWGSPPNPATVMNATGVKWFTMAFILSNGYCNPMWDGNRPLTGGDDQSKINSIRSAGGDIVVSFGGWSGNKLGEKCSSASSLAGAYQKVTVRVSTLEGEFSAWVYVFAGYEGGMPTAWYLSEIANAAEKAGAPDDYVDDLRRRPTRTSSPEV